MRKIKLNQHLTMLSLTVALGAAVYLNWEYSQTGAGAVQEDAVSASAAQVVYDPLETTGESLESGNKNYGEAQLVSVGENTGDSFFEEARLTRTRTRDEALDALKKILKSTTLTEEEKQSLTEQLNSTLDSITTESEIETLIKAKGFVDSVVFIDGSKVHVTVMTENDGLTKGEVAQIRDIILSKCATTAQDITVVEVK